MTATGLALLGLAVLAAIFPLAIAVPVALIAFWIAATLLARAIRLRRSRPERPR
jgi:hypothetical protein